MWEETAEGKAKENRQEKERTESNELNLTTGRKNLRHGEVGYINKKTRKPQARGKKREVPRVVTLKKRVVSEKPGSSGRVVGCLSPGTERKNAAKCRVGKKKGGCNRAPREGVYTAKREGENSPFKHGEGGAMDCLRVRRRNGDPEGVQPGPTPQRGLRAWRKRWLTNAKESKIKNKGERGREEKPGGRERVSQGVVGWKGGGRSCTGKGKGKMHSKTSERECLPGSVCFMVKNQEN